MWKFSSLGIRIDGWRLTYHRSFDVAAFCEPMIINDGRHCPRYARLCGPWHRHGRFGSRSPGFALLFSLGLVWLSVPFSLFRHVLTCGGMRHCVWSGSLHTPEALMATLLGSSTTRRARARTSRSQVRRSGGRRLGSSSESRL